MKKHLKRLTAMIICLSLTLSVGVLPVRAQTDDLSVRLFCTDNAALQCSVLVLGWYGFYLEHAAVGEIPDVTLEYTEADGTARTIAVEKDKILQEVYAVESDPAARKCVPQLTVCLPMYAVYLPQDTIVRVSAGAFRTADGEPFPAVSAPISDFWEEAYILLKGTTEVLESANQTVEGKQMNLHATVPGWFESVWTPHLEFTDNGKPVENTYTLQGAGTHTVCASLNPFLTASFTITTVSEAEAYRINTRFFGKDLWKATLALLGGVVTFPLIFTGLPFLLLSSGMLSGGAECYESFFKSLFRTEVTTRKHVFHEDQATILAA